jgi:hypothetical protein
MRLNTAVVSSKGKLVSKFLARCCEGSTGADEYLGLGPSSYPIVSLATIGKARLDENFAVA